MRIDILTLFPEMCEAVLNESIVGRARKDGIVQIFCHNIRDYTLDKHRRVDDYPYGGGLGMIIQAEPIAACFEAIIRQTKKKPYCIYMSPQGRTFNQKIAKNLCEMNNIALLCGHYEGIDERIIEEYIDEEISIGDFVLTGGELPAMAVADAIIRMIPGVLSQEGSFEDESHFSGLLEYPQYTRPAVWRKRSVPEVLLSGHHANIIQWRKKQALMRTMQKRPDMFDKIVIDKDNKKLIASIESELNETLQ